jgi:hypothetical protein
MVLGIKHDSVINAIVQTFSIAMFDQQDNHGDLTTEHALWMIRWLHDYGTANDTRPDHPVQVLLDDIFKAAIASPEEGIQEYYSGMGNAFSTGIGKVESEPIRILMNEFVEDSLEEV